MPNLFDYVEVTASFAERHRANTEEVTTNGVVRYYAKNNFVQSATALAHTRGLVADIHDFHERFGLQPAEKSGDVSDELLNFRYAFMKEELDEFSEAMKTRDNEAMFDALIDLVYVAIGTAYLCNWPFNTGWSRVHTANMKKQRAESKEQSKRDTAFDVVKPFDWTPPVLSDLVTPVPAIDAVTDASIFLGRSL